MSINNDINVVWGYINGKSSDKIYENFNRIKTFIINNPNDEISIKIKNWLLLNLKAEFQNPELINSFMINDEKKYLKQLMIFKNLPFMLKKNEFIYYFNSLIFSPSEYYGTHKNFYKGCKWFFEGMNDFEIPNSTFTKLDYYCESNPTIFRGSFNYYDTYENELDRLRVKVNGQYPDDWKKEKESIEYDLRHNYSHYDDYDITSSYISKKLGIVGEYDIFNKVKNLNNSIFVAKDFGNGFGYDIFYTLNGPYNEILLEVKATLNLNGDDYFSLSKNEKDVLIDTINRDNCEFVVVRVYVDLKKDNNFYYKLLKYDKNDNSFISVNNEDNNIIEYFGSEDDPLLFKRKAKIYEYKN